MAVLGSGKNSCCGSDQANTNIRESESAATFSLPGLYSMVKSNPKNLCNQACCSGVCKD